jgi:archaellum biogenesis protein FlaJ (TadC family)
MDEQISPKKNPFIKWLKGWATKILLFSLALLLFGLISSVLNFIGIDLSEGDSTGGIWNLFWLIIWTVSGISMLIFILIVMKTWFKKYK